MAETKQTGKVPPEILALMVVCILLNLGLGFLVSAVKLPFYLDSIGTVLAAYLLGPAWGIAVGILSVLIGSIYTPTLWAYAATAIAISIYTSVAKKVGFLEKFPATVILGLLLGVVASLVSAPVTAILYGGVSLSGTDLITSLFRASGKSLVQSVLYGGLSSDPIDKLLTSIVAMLLLKRLPNFVKKWRR